MIDCKAIGYSSGAHRQQRFSLDKVKSFLG